VEQRNQGQVLYGAAMRMAKSVNQRKSKAYARQTNLTVTVISCGTVQQIVRSLRRLAQSQAPHTVLGSRLQHHAKSMRMMASLAFLSKHQQAPVML
jgi:hypothetical protein